MTSESHIARAVVDQMVELVYELLDAHGDTVLLADELVQDGRWRAHLDYLRDLQRVGREALARAGDTGGRRVAHGLVKEI
jgi:hypothetical protein